ncbi:MAG TPA: YdiU family protein [Pyrinomonadaceae bacterium]|nr:YdiU family protein [Pyrinomonadaceae bacterium]
MKLNLKDTFNQELPADSVTENYVRQVFNAAFSYVTPKIPGNPKLIHASPQMIEAIGLTEIEAKSEDFLNAFSGKEVFPDTNPYAMCYGGHQFGNWAGQLGDGRAINLFEVNQNEQQWALQLKGSGKTPYSRGADGLAVLRSSVREYLCSEAMFHLGVPTTRALSLVLTGDEVLRDMLYNGNAAYEKGAIVCRVAPSFIRFGNFQIFAWREDFENLKKLTDYTIRHFYPHLGEPNKETYIEFFREIVGKTLDLIIHWERVGFVHGVMNTDNMSILGLTIDYGPYGWLEDYDPNWTPNTTDAGQKRYRYGNQAAIGLWNLLQLGNALFPLIQDAKPLEEILDSYQINYLPKHICMMSDKLGLKTEVEADLIIELEQLLYQSEMDLTLFFRNLNKFDENNPSAFWTILQESSYSTNLEILQDKWTQFLQTYAEILIAENREKKERTEVMNGVNPKYVLRNYMAQLAIDAADEDDFSIVDELFNLLLKPYDEQPEAEKWFAKRPDWAKEKVGCSMLSCSS